MEQTVGMEPGRTHHEPTRRAGGRTVGRGVTLGRALGWPLYPWIFAAYPVLLVYSDNLGEGIELSELVLPTAVATTIMVIAYLASWLVLKSVRRAAVAATAIVIPCMLFASIVAVLDAMWTAPSIVLTQVIALLLCVIVALLGVAVAAATRREPVRMTEALNVMASVLFVMVLVPILRYELWQTDVQTLVPDRVAAQPAATTSNRDIYHFVFDRYGSQSALMAGPGIDNSEFMDWLREQGFQVVEDARANYWRTVPALGSMFRMSLLDDVAEEMGPDNPNPGPLLELLRSNPAGATLQELGYTYVHLGAWYRELTRSDIADYVHAPDYQVDFASTVFDGTAVPFVQGLVAIATGPAAGGTIAPMALATLDQIDLVESMVSVASPKLVYAHFMLPHRPYVFLEDGTIDPGRATYESQLRYSNHVIRRLVEPLLAKSEADQPIIILQAEEGPYPERYDEMGNDFDWSTATDEELLTKYGILSAWYLPGHEGAAPLQPGMSLVNTYPEILGRYQQLDIARQPDRSYAARDGRIWDQIDITPRLDDAMRAHVAARE